MNRVLEQVFKANLNIEYGKLQFERAQELRTLWFQS